MRPHVRLTRWLDGWGIPAPYAAAAIAKTVPVAHDDLAVVTTKDENAHLPPGAQPRIFGPGSHIRQSMREAVVAAVACRRRPWPGCCRYPWSQDVSVGAGMEVGVFIHRGDHTRVVMRDWRHASRPPRDVTW